MKPLFTLGLIVATPGAITALADLDGGMRRNAQALIDRHMRGDWGDTLSAGDRLANNAAVDSGERILSAYVLPNGKCIWISTEADRSSTCILLPEEY